MSSYNILNKVKFELNGSGKLFDYHRYQFEYHRLPDSNLPVKNKEFTVSSIDNRTFEFANVLNIKNGKYCSTKDGFFVWELNGGRLVLDGKKKIVAQKHLFFKNRFSKMKSNMIIDLLLRLHLAEQGYTLIHAACVANNRGAAIIPAWKGTGKTALTIKLISRGYHFLADDKVWISESGKAWAYPRYAVIKDSNALEFPQFTSLQTKIKIKLKQRLLSSERFSNYYLKKIVNKILRVPAKYYRIDELYPEASILDNSGILNLVSLIKTMGDNQVINPFNTDQLISMVSKINFVEWNCELFQIADAHDILFPEESNWRDELQELLKIESNNLYKGLSGKPSFKVEIPVDDSIIDWDKIITMFN